MTLKNTRMDSIPDILGSIGSRIFSLFITIEMIRRYCPREIINGVDNFFKKLSYFFNPYIQISIHEFVGNNLRPHEAYATVGAYLSINSSKTARKLKAEKVRDSNKMVMSMDEHETVFDQFHGVEVKWISGKNQPLTKTMQVGYYSSFPEQERKYYKLVFHEQYRDLMFGPYLEHVIKTGREIRERNRLRKLYTNCHYRSVWSYILFEHPATFETLAMEPEKKEEIVEDLLTFTKSKDFYARIGKAWKRGYLLYGPPGTGKSTMIAAMANLLDYDIYDLELTSVRDNTQLRRLLSETSGKSIIVIEDIDCSLDLTDQRRKKQANFQEKMTGKCRKEESESKVTLSGLLNFIDGLWSACGGERIIVFTTNYVNKLDPALTRSGRMDKHIELSYCNFQAFKVLAKNYLLLDSHPLFESIRQLMEVTQITPADVAENLMPKTLKEDAEKSLLSLIQALEDAKEKQAMKEECGDDDQGAPDDEDETTHQKLEEEESQETEDEEEDTRENDDQAAERI